MILLLLSLTASLMCSQLPAATATNIKMELIKLLNAVPAQKTVAQNVLPRRSKDMSPKRAIVVGASVGMGREISKLLAADGYIVGMTARRLSLLEEIQQ